MDKEIGQMEPVEEICREFIQGRISRASLIGDGRINDTFCVKAGEESFICQRIQRKMDTDILEHNYLLYSAALDRVKLAYPKWLRDRDGRFFYTDCKGNHWRMYPMIGGTVLQVPLPEEALFACGRALAGIHAALQGMAEKPKAVFPMLHDLKYYYEKYLCVLEHDLSGKERDPELEKYFASGIEEFRNLQTDRTAVIHGDPKLANILFSEGNVKAFIDLDTVMPGAVIEDVADCVRSCCAWKGKIDTGAQQIFLQGYQSRDNGLLNGKDLKCLPQVIRKIRFELGLRYYTDAIAEEKSFKEKYPGYLMGKARENCLYASEGNIYL